MGLDAGRVDEQPVGEFSLKLQQFPEEDGLVRGFVPVYQHKSAVGFGFQDGFQN